jgi:hypothetical protein
MGRLANEKSKCKNNKMTGNTIYLSILALNVMALDSANKRRKGELN